MRVFHQGFVVLALAALFAFPAMAATEQADSGSAASGVVESGIDKGVPEAVAKEAQRRRSQAIVIKAPPPLPDPTKTPEPKINVVKDLPKTTPPPEAIVPEKPKKLEYVKPDESEASKPAEPQTAPAAEEPAAVKPKTGFGALLDKFLGKGEERVAPAAAPAPAETTEAPPKAEEQPAPEKKAPAKRKAKEAPAKSDAEP